MGLLILKLSDYRKLYFDLIVFKKIINEITFSKSTLRQAKTLLAVITQIINKIFRKLPQ